MSLDFQELHHQVKKIGEQAQAFSESVNEKRIKAKNMLAHYANDLPNLRQKVKRAGSASLSLRCALPKDEPLNGHYPAPQFQPGIWLLTADGSQILPDRHAQVNYSLVNVGALRLHLGNAAAPEIFTRCELFYEELYDDTFSVSDISLKRDLLERQVFVELISGMQTDLNDSRSPIVTLTDGTLELWGAKGSEEDSGNSFRKVLESYKKILQRLRELDVTTAAYVDKPHANYILKLLEVASLPDDALDQAAKVKPYMGVSDEVLLADIIAPGERSSVFGIQSQSDKDYQDEIALHFFYLNVGKVGHPWLARVEIPAWVADSSEKLGLLHAVLLQQCRTLGNDPYPYLLHRAHEAAVVTFAEKEQLTQMIVGELMKYRVAIGKVSHKQHHKNHGGRTRMK